MVTTEVIITGLTVYFFLKVLFIKPRVDADDDSYQKNNGKSIKKVDV